VFRWGGGNGRGEGNDLWLEMSESGVIKPGDPSKSKGGPDLWPNERSPPGAAAPFGVAVEPG